MIREIRFETKYMFSELFNFIKYRDTKYLPDAKYHFSKIICEFKYPFRCLVSGIKNLITWFPVIWNDRQYDHNYFYDVLIKKLTLMEDFWYSDKTHVCRAKSIGRQVRTCKNLAIMIRDGKIEEDVYDKFHAIYGHLEYGSKVVKADRNGEPELFEMTSSEFSSANISKDEYREKFREAMFKARDKHTKYQKALYRIMNKYSAKWWD